VGASPTIRASGFWARGCRVSTVGRDEAAVSAYIVEQGKEEQRFDQLETLEGHAASIGSETNPLGTVHNFKLPALLEVVDCFPAWHLVQFIAWRKD